MTNNKIIWASGILIALLGFILIFALIILKGTPFFYSFHPNVSNEAKEDAVEKIVYTLQDTIAISQDSIITHKVKLLEPPKPTPPITPTIEELGTFGDSAGFWNAIFSALAMIAVVITLCYQFHKDRRDDQRIAIAQFQDQFFKLLSILSDIVSELRISPNDEPGFSYNIPGDAGWDMAEGNGHETPMQAIQEKDITGRACFRYIYHQKPNGRNLGEYIINNTSSEPNDIPSEELYKSLHKIIGENFDHYFRTVYRILKFIDDIDLGNCEQKKQDEVRNLCADLLRAQLSTFELALIYYNGLYPQFRDTSKRLYEQYCIFDNLDPQILILRSEKEYYDYVRSNHKNKDGFNPSIHYEFTAFTSGSGKSDTNMTTSQNSKCLRIVNSLLKFFHIGKNGSVSSQTQEEINSDAKAVYDIIKKKEKQIITNDALKTLSGLSKRKIKAALYFLKENGYILEEKRGRGTKYKVQKKYP